VGKAAGNLFVADQALTDLGTDPVTKSWRGPSIIKITPDGAKSTFATGLENLRELTLDATGNVYVSSAYAILRFTPGGTKNTFSSESDADSLAVDRSGNVFAWNRHDAVLKFDPSGTPTTFSRDLSPDKQWEYKRGQIVKAGTTQVVLDASALEKGARTRAMRSFFRHEFEWHRQSRSFALQHQLLRPSLS